jgi:hypothetical protein
MFTLSFDSNRRVLLAQFAGVLSTEDIEGFDKALAAFVSRHGFARGIFDFSSVQANAVPQSFLVWRARLPQILLGQERIIVAPQPEIYEPACAYAAQARLSGLSETPTACSNLSKPTSSRRNRFSATALQAKS